MNEQELYGSGPMTDPLTVLMQMPPGSALYSITDTGIGPQTDFMIREDDQHIKKIPPKSPEIRMRSGLIEQDGVSLVPVLILIDRNFDMLYEVWFNWWPHQQHLRHLAKQRKVNIHVYDDRAKRRSLQINNAMADDFSRYVTELEKVQEWSMTQFNAAREAVYARYQKPEDMWKALLPM